MPQGLSVSRIVEVDVSFAPVAIPLLNFDTLLIMGDSNVIDTTEALREYNQLEDVAGDFGTTAPEYLAADLYFSQVPQPTQLYIGRWAQTSTSGVLAGGLLSGQQQLITNWVTITTGGFEITFDGGTALQVSGINLSTPPVTNLNGVASAVQTAIRAAGSGGAAATCIWTGQQFKITSGTAGATSSVSFMSTPSAGVTDMSAQMMMTASTAEYAGSGSASETPLQAVVRVDGRGWYGLMFASTHALLDTDHIAIAGYIEGTADKHIYGITSNESAILAPLTTSDIASQLSLADYIRTFIQFSTSNPYAVASFFGRAFTVNFEGSNTTITMKFKKEPGILPELLTSSQADTLAAKRCNVYVQYNNGASIIQEGVMSGLAYFDEIHGTDWYANRVQTDLFNILYQSPKIPQTDPGIHILTAGCDGASSQGVVNGLIAPGIWNAPGFGQLNTGDRLKTGWYTFAQSVDQQDQSLREQRVAPLIQIAIKLAGAVHSADVLVNVNR